MDNLQEKVENFAGIKIRRGYSKWIPKALELLKIDDLNRTNSIKIVNFINCSSSNCSHSYWMLYKNYDERDAKIKASGCIDRFYKSSYTKSDRSSVNSKLVYENKSRGYSGYLEIGGTIRYCRSTNEFIAWNLFSKQYGIENIKYESITFDVNGLFNYRPDFLIYDGDCLKKIIEVKNNDFIDSGRYEIISDFLKSNNIDYEVITNLKSLVDVELAQKIKDWKNSDRVIAGNKGERNPRFGVQLSNETKRKISERAKERCANPDYIQKLSIAQRKRYIDNPNLKYIQSEIAKKREKDMSPEIKAERIKKFKKTWDANHRHNVLCNGDCGKMLYIINTHEPYCKECRIKRNKLGFSSKCGFTCIEMFFDDWIADDGIDVITLLETQNPNSLNKLLLTRKRKINKINAKVGLSSIQKYVGSVEKLITNLKEKYESNKHF